MKTIFILYMPGHAGNFLARLFSLGDETMPQLPVDYLKYIVANGVPDHPLNRLELYSFDRVTDQYDKWQDFHRAWGDFHHSTSYNLLNVFLNNKQAVIYAIHPHEFNMCCQVIDQIESVEYYAVSLADSYQPWVERYRTQLDFVWRDGEQHLFDQLKQQYNMREISLTSILTDEQEFLNEYTQVCSVMNLTPQITQAVELYHSWHRVRG